MASPNDLATTNLWSFIAFFMAFFVYVCFQIITGNTMDMKDIYYTVFFFYIITFIIQVSSNAYITGRKEVCGKTDLGVSFSSTIYPWLFIFGLTIILIILIPGWLRIFSNTFGLYCAKAYGLNDFLLQNIFTKRNNEPTTTTTANIELLKTIDSVYNDPSLLINELDPRDFVMTKTYNETTKKNDIKIDWKSFQKILDSGIITQPPNEDILKKLYDHIMLKEAVGFSVWIFLSGIISVIVSTNILLNEGCKKGLASNYNAVFST
jgi:hypothetical protein